MLRELAASGDLAALMHQQPPGGRLHERRIVADFLARERGLAAEPERIFLVNGAQQGLDIAVRALLRPGDAVAVDALTYPGFRMLAELQDLDLQPVPALDEGPDLDALERLCTPAHTRHPCHAHAAQPLGWVMPLAQRQRLVEIARRHDCLLIEDAAYAFLAGKAPAALATLAPERCIHVSSLSKSVASGLRFGFMVVPQAWAGRVKAVVRASHWSMPGLVTAMATRWMASGSVRQQEQRMRQEARRRQAIARKALAGMQMLAHPCSLFLWLRLPGELRMDRAATALAQCGIAVSQAHAYATTPHARMRCAWDWVRCLCRNWRPYSFSCGIPWKAFRPEPVPGQGPVQGLALQRRPSRSGCSRCERPLWSSSCISASSWPSSPLGKPSRANQFR